MGSLAQRRSQTSSSVDAPTTRDLSGKPRIRGVPRARRLWDRRVLAWEHHAAVGLEQVVTAVVAVAAPTEGISIVDLGCGTGQLSLRLARAGAKVMAVDISPMMIAVLDRKAAEYALQIETAALPLQEVTIEPASVDVVVSNYVMHHIHDDEKRAALASAVSWLRPGGRLIVGDMMFGRGATKQDREIIRTKVRVMARRGPAGWWRIAKNAARFSLRVRERPLPMQTWIEMLRSAGLGDVQGVRVIAEAAVVVGTKPAV